MRRSLELVFAASVFAAAAFGQAEGVLERLEYSVNYPSGLPLGTARLETKEIVLRDGTPGREFTFELQAAAPGAQVEDRYRSRTSAAYCSLEFEKDARHGKKVVRERTSFDPQAGQAVRRTLEEGGESRFPVPECAKDALAYLQHVRREMAAGRVPPAATVYFGAAYQVRLEYGGRQRIAAAGESLDTDRLQVTVKGPASEYTFQMFLAVEPERRPVQFRVTLPQGLFLMELAEQP